MQAVALTTDLLETGHLVLHTDQDCKLGKLMCDGGKILSSAVGAGRKKGQPKTLKAGAAWKKGEPLRLVVEPDVDDDEEPGDYAYQVTVTAERK